MEKENGFLLINKPATWTSHDVIGYLRRVTHIKRIGHAGTLDPFATGLLIVAVGRENTKRLDEFKGMEKVYEATLRLGSTSDTYDKTGVIVEESEKSVSIDEIKSVLGSFVGEQDQLPPLYSAKKVEGTPMYKLARKGVEVERKPHHIQIFEIEILNFSFPLLKIKVRCSTGTYIRTMVHDIGQKLGVGAYCEELDRTQIGPYLAENSTPVKEFSRDNWKNLLF